MNAPDFANPSYWLEFPEFDENCKQLGDWGKQGLEWLQGQLKKVKSKALMPRFWDRKDFGKSNPNNPITGISWYEASAYCEWLFQNWDALPESKANLLMKPQTIRLPLETEWITAAGGENPEGRYPWDEAGKATTSLKEIVRCANVEESRIGHTTPVNAYLRGASPYGVMDMSGNIWEWQANYFSKEHDVLCLHGGAWVSQVDDARVASRFFTPPFNWYNTFGFRVLALPNKRS